MGFIIVYLTNENLEKAQEIARHLLENRLIACANFIPIESAYWWKEKIQNEKEVVALLKTKEENWDAVKEEIEKIHPYETPCIMKMDVDANEDYEKWIRKETE